MHPFRFEALGAAIVAFLIASASACTSDTSGAPNASEDEISSEKPEAPAQASGPSSFFGSSYVEDHQSVTTASDGDLWPSCWSNDDALYAANGDGKAFGGPFVDIAVSRVTGSPFSSPSDLKGTTVSRADAIGQIWTPGNYNRKPTGMLCVDGKLYLAVQDLAKDFMDAPAATIALSMDHGATWSWDHAAPMFDDHVMTTLMFLDYGKDNANAIDGFVYVYALDQNWRFSSRVPSPTKLWMARVPKGNVQTRSAWEYFAGTAADGSPRFDASIAKRMPVLEDASLVYQHPFNAASPHDMTTLSQGSIVYDAPLKRYLYTSWTEFTFEFFEAPQPWGPWKKFLSRDYGVYPWFASLNGGYATTIPSKFISPDGKTMFVQSNTFVGQYSTYDLSFRKLTLDPLVSGPPSNAVAPSRNLAAASNGGTPISRAGHGGPTSIGNDAVSTGSVDSWTGESKTEDFWGVTWPRAYTVNRIDYTTGRMFPDGGWFADLRVQVRRNGTWTDIPGTAIAPAYPGTPSAGDDKTYTFGFSPVVGDGVRVIGTPGGTATFTSSAELAAFYQ